MTRTDFVQRPAAADFLMNLKNLDYSCCSCFFLLLWLLLLNAVVVAAAFYYSCCFQSAASAFYAALAIVAAAAFATVVAAKAATAAVIVFGLLDMLFLLPSHLQVEHLPQVWRESHQHIVVAPAAAALDLC